MYGHEVWSLASIGNCIYAGANNGIYYSTNNGDNWVKFGLNEKVFGIGSIGNSIFAGTISGIYRTTNYGASWSFDSIPYTSSFATIGNKIFAGTGNNVIISTNYGISWAQTSLFKTTTALIAIGSNLIAGVYGSSPSSIYISTNDGANWSQSSLTGNIGINSLYLSQNNLLAGTGHGIYKSTNYGMNWNRIGFADTVVYAVASSGNNIFASPNGYYLIGQIGLGIFLTTNDGLVWRSKNEGFPSYYFVWTFLIFNDYLFAGTLQSFVWRRSLSEIIGIRNISIEAPSKYCLYQNYPNPFNPETRIRYSIKMSAPVTLIVYDALGREVQSLVNEKQAPGTYEAVFDASRISSGVYFYRLTTEGYSETRKMVVIK